MHKWQQLARLYTNSLSVTRYIDIKANYNGKYSVVSGVAQIKFGVERADNEPKCSIVI